MNQILNTISLDKILETTTSLLISLLFAFCVWLIKLAYEKRTKELHSISEIERMFVYNNAIISDYKELLKLWCDALQSHEGYTARFSLFNLGKDIKTTILDLKFVNQYFPAVFSLDRLESDVANLYELYSETAKLLINRDEQTEACIKKWNLFNDDLFKIIEKISNEVPKIQDQVIEVIAHSRLLGRQKNFSVFQLLTILNRDIYPKIKVEDIIKEGAVINNEMLKKKIK